MEIDLKKISLLVVDDSSINQRVVAMSLRNTIEDIDVASDGLEAFEKYCAKQYDVIIMDGRMPVMDGYESTRKIRQFEIDQGIDKKSTIIALTGSDTDEESKNCIDSGMNASLLKPFRLTQFLDILKEIS
ncbi:response regulator [uncultured Sunxiuqinia sp.]|uniref:response regulator n=1 Tax=uncultured Sunxiuqinia sp. TaxID=1573825 RepID=UPI002AA68120|nr:response regulator [uncultured Sunxiuqinia sp.]